MFAQKYVCASKFSFTCLSHKQRHLLGKRSPGNLKSFTTSTLDNLDGFVNRTKKFGADALMGKLKSYGGFDSCLNEMEVIEINRQSGTVWAKLSVTKELMNAFGTLHGGASCTIIDVAGTFAILAKNNGEKPGVSTEINCTFCSASSVGETIMIKGEVVKMGRRLAFTQVTIYDEKVEKVIATGRHTKMFP